MGVLGFRRRSTWAVTMAVGVLVSGLAGCGAQEPTTPADHAAPADLILDPDDLPSGFRPTQFTVSDLVAGNRGPIDAAKSAEVTPPDCRPTADADLNPQLTAANSAVLGARSSSASLVELVTTARRDIEADIRVTTGRCATTTTVVGSGNLRGARIVTRYSEVPTPGIGTDDRRVGQSLALRSMVSTTLPDGATSTQVGYAGYALVERPDGSSVTVQLTVSGDASPASRTPTPPVEPMTSAAFADAFGDAVEAAHN
ncbi:hypothetical protein AAFP35_01870 [Gordonia sp. CPCC 206044]|uniref:hypothetical protein n=1 Tax=Gordonia sp. CPCC 206044 TaxID=3140793 RepID=UPI003AF35B0D